MRRTPRTAVLVTALAGATVLSGCQDTGLTPTDPSAASSTAGSPATQATSSAGPVGPDGSDAGRREVLTDHGGYVVQGSKVTFVYRNGMRHQVDVGQSAPTQDATVRTDRGTLVLKNGSATFTDDHGATTVTPQGAGAVADATGTIVVTPGGSTTCADSEGLQFVGSDGSKGALDENGVFYTDKDGKTVSEGRSPEVKELAGRYTVCNVGNTATVDLYSDVLFEFDSAELTTAGRASVDAAARLMRGVTRGKGVAVTGHTDSVGPMADNEALGMRRAEAVAKQLRAALPGVKFAERSAGETEPVAANVTPDGQDNPSGRAKNRRVTITWDK